VPEEEIEDLPCAMRLSARSSARVNLKESSVEWLSRAPSGRPPYDEHAAPVDWAAARLAERHHLPRKTIPSLVWYILTLDRHWVTGLELLEVEVHRDQAADDPDAFVVLVKGIDEYITSKDWQRVWSNFVRPRQETLWGLRGGRPQGRRTVELKRLQEWIALYNRMVTENISVADLIKGDKEAALVLDKPMLDRDQETMRRALNDLRKLLTPSP